MLRSLALGLGVLLALSPGLAHADPLDKALDAAFFEAPMSVEAFRRLSGLSVPPPEPQPAAIDIPRDAQRMLFSARRRCRTDYARSVLSARVAVLGAQHPYIGQWIDVQRAVLEACTARHPTAVTLPPALALDSAALRRLQEQDRAYQGAAATFYGGDAEAARAAFEAIAQDAASPHRRAATYMLVDRNKDADPTGTLGQAQAILEDATAKPLHADAQALIGYLAYNSLPEAERLRAELYLELSAQPVSVLEADPVLLQRYRQAVADFPRIHGGLEPGWWLQGDAPDDYYIGSQSLAEAARDGNDIAAWALMPPSPYSQEAWTVAAARMETAGWRALQGFVAASTERAGSAWMVADRSFASDYQPRFWQRIDADLELLQHRGEKAERSLARLAPLFFHQVRTALMNPDPAFDAPFLEAVQRMQTYPYRDSRHFDRLRIEALRYLMSTGRIQQARQWRDALDLAQPGGDLLVLLAEDDRQLAAALRGETRDWENRLPTAKLVALADISSTPQWRDIVHSVAWTRSYALGDPIDSRLDATVRRLNPHWQSAVGAQPGDRALLLDVAETPTMNIAIGWFRGPRTAQEIDLYDPNDENWWCPLDLQAEDRIIEDAIVNTMFANPGERFADTDAPGTLARRAALEPLLQASHYWNSIDPEERQRLAELEGAPFQIGRPAIDWAENLGWFEAGNGADRALAATVRITRYGCRRLSGTGAISHRAFELLHDRFPDSAAAKATPYWFPDWPQRY